MSHKENVKKLTNKNIHKFIAKHVGERYDKYREAWNEATPENIPEFPIHLDFEFYDNCNQRCVFCPRNTDIHNNLEYKINTDSILDMEHIDTLIEECQKNNLYSVNFGAFAEPLLFKKLFVIIKKFISSGVVDTRIITNGLLLNKYIDEIFDSKLLNLYISLDAFSEEVYSKQRGVGYKKVISNVLKILDEKKIRNSVFPITRVSFVETDENKHELDDFVNFWKDKVDFIDLQLKIDYTQDNIKSNEKQWTCIDPFRRLSVIANGEVLPCCSFFGRNLVIGNIHNETLKEVWHSDKMQQIREDLLNDKSKICLICQGC